MTLKLRHVLQSPESTPTSTSGSSPGTGGAPDGAPDVGGRVTDEPVVDKGTDWDALSTPDDEVPPNGETPDSTGEEPAAPAPSQPAAKPADGQPSKPGDQPPADQPAQPGKPEKPGDQPGDQPAQPPAQPEPETAEQKAAREKAQAEAEEKAFGELRDYYKLPDDYVERLRTEPELVLPELAAKVHQAVFRGMQQYMTQAVPQFLQMHAKVQEANTKTKEAFFDRWPSLKGHDEQVLQIAAMYAQMNPKATPQEKLSKVGQLACAALGIDPDPEPGTSGKPPAARPPAKGTPPAKPGAFRPSNPAGSSSAAPPPSDNVYTKLAEEMLEEDRGQ